MTFKQGTMIRNSLIWCGLAAGIIVSGSALGQYYPNRQIIILVGIAAGGITDVTTRQYAAVVSKNIDQNIIIENRPVAGGAVAAAAVQSAAPDGYTLLSVVGSQFFSVPAMGPAPYDPLKGFAPISLTFRLSTLLVVPMDSPAKTVAELLAWGKTKPGGLLLGSPGAGTPGHLLAAKIALATNTPIQYLHYRGGAPVMADLIAGRLLECVPPSLSFLISFLERHQRADEMYLSRTSLSLRRLLCARRERPRGSAAEQRDELAPFQLIELHSVPSQGPIAGYRISEDQSGGVALAYNEATKSASEQRSI